MIRVVIAEDDPSVARILSKVISTMGYDPVRCSDGRRALHVIQDNPDTRLLITDVSMPNMDGRELVQWVRSDKDHAKLPVIIISALMAVSEISPLLDNDVTCFLAKPVNIEDLRTQARSFIERSAVPSE